MITSRDTESRVLVGFDGTAAARAAVPVAATEAVLRGARLRIVRVVETAAGTVPAQRTPVGEVDAGREHEAVQLARLTLPADRIDVETVHGFALDELLIRSVGAELLVLGRRQPISLDVLLGSVALGAATRAPCPVLVVGEARLGGPPEQGIVMVGVDGRLDSEAALQEAFTEAALRGVQLVAIHTWRGFTSAGMGEDNPLNRDPLRLAGDDTRALRKIVEPFRARFPLVPVTEQLVEGVSARVLVELSAQAGLLVVGTRGRGPIKGLLMGSVSQHVVAHARCPVLVARSRDAAVAAPIRASATGRR